MIQVIYGTRGSGNSKKILECANSYAKEASGSFVFIDNDKSFMLDLDRSIRYIDSREYDITSPKFLTGFIYGIAASDFDLQYIFVDSFIAIVKHSLFVLDEMFTKLEEFTNSRNITLVLSISSDESDLPEFIKKYIINK